jgi:hypothetical protein
MSLDTEISELHETVETINQKIDTELDIFRDETKTCLQRYNTDLRIASDDDLNNACKIIRRTRLEEALNRLSEHLQHVDAILATLKEILAIDTKKDSLTGPRDIMKTRGIQTYNQCLHSSLMSEYQSLKKLIHELDIDVINVKPTDMFIITNMVVQSYKATGYEYVYPHEMKRSFVETQRKIQLKVGLTLKKK